MKTNGSLFKNIEDSSLWKEKYEISTFTGYLPWFFFIYLAVTILKRYKTQNIFFGNSVFQI